MKLITSISIRISVLTTIVLSIWAVAFYFAIMEEVNDETDDALEDYAESIIIRSLVGEEVPTSSLGTNNQYFHHEVSAEYAATHPHVRYEDRNVFIKEKHEYEPARVLTYIYTDDHDRFYELEVSTPTIEKHDLREAIVHWLLILFASLLLGLILLSIFSVQRTMRPLHKLLQWIARFRIGGDNPPLDNPTRITEFRTLNNSVEESFLRGSHQFEHQKRFLGHAAHELQTPIAVCINRLEMLMEEVVADSAPEADNTNNMLREELSRQLQTLQHMSRLNSTLLTMSRIENGQYLNAEEVDLAPILQSLTEDIGMVFASRNITVSTQLDGHFAPRINRQLATMLVTNLIKNAFVHNNDGGTISITLADNLLRIANSGQAEPIEASLVFLPFVHDPQKGTSTGLGLAMAQSICQHNHFELSYHFENGMHIFEVKPDTE